MPSRKKSGGSSNQRPLGFKAETGRFGIKRVEARFLIHSNMRATLTPDWSRMVDVEHIRLKDGLLRDVENLIVVSVDEHKRLATVESDASPPAPPSSFLLSLLLPATKSTSDFITNMEETFQLSWVPKYGLRRAKLAWWVQNVRYLVTQLVVPVGGLIVGAIKLLRLG
ncbi:hypothetical protein [Mesorhizobium sp. WSM4906]|uniref:hypothetical protein n=1 Tax=Mesorhizobium sp. WSM4906 TaxID=3038546 RepID=UPI002417D61F|nr:hypothetical protein [Mesorhizobium sp. WSM4906]WFP74480.1 hypothetical protein QAZ22_22410 [Mesorhizobium sp. WSM4906]